MGDVGRWSTRRPISDSRREGTRAGELREFSDSKIKFCWCPPGKFTMGSPKTEKGRSDDEDQVEVTLSRGFWMGACEVTQGEWSRVMGALPDEVTEKAGIGDDFPLYNVNYAEAQALCVKLTA